MVAEAETCEKGLREDIQQLEMALKDDSTVSEQVESILNSTLSPLDSCWTLSALLGRLSDEWTLPSLLMAMEERTEDLTAPLQPCKSAQRRSEVESNTLYHAMTSEENLLLVWKRVANHQSTNVFKRAVKPEEAPGYGDRIKFPLDWSVVRKLIQTKHIQTMAALHRIAALIAHNCVQYNGRESDYGRVAREFEGNVLDTIRQVLLEDGKNTPSVQVAAPVPSA